MNTLWLAIAVTLRFTIPSVVAFIQAETIGPVDGLDSPEVPALQRRMGSDPGLTRV